MDQAALYQAIIEKLTKVIDPETGADVIRMQLVQNIRIDIKGKVTYTFRPSSPLCPIAAPLAVMIIQAIGEVEGVTRQGITVVDYVEADKLNEIFQAVLES
ncbi:MAG: iron-sulfur cluster assembly protein [Chloroflexi bacterium]|jgi:metal-sulfur cluster biosynthetic enzyme|nr:iron-sulfur cluster assembly protein [Anaerolineaceae bacterium]NMB90501.1 iron-sulfur cluster assembly protein [Chloroflexota bacterium]